MTPLATKRASRLSEAGFTYDEVGGAATRESRAGFRSLSSDQPVAAAPEVALERLMTWRMHEGAGLLVRASAVRVAPGVVAVLEPGIGPLRLRAPVRVVEAHDTGFSYGTLPGHPEIGEERFDIVPDGDRCRLLISGFSRPGRRTTRLAGPLARVLQDMILRRYARALSDGCD